MTTREYYTILLAECRKSHSFHIREARRWQYCLREACMDEARADLRAARRYIKIIRENRNDRI